MSLISGLRALFRTPPGATVAEGPKPAMPVLAVGDAPDWPAILRAVGFADPDRWAAAVAKPASRYGITAGRRAAAFAATIGHESEGGRLMVESLNYSAKALPQKFGPHRGMTAEIANRIGRLQTERGVVLRVADQRAIANIVYGGAWGAKHLGNTLPGDGWQWRGRGATQLTGKANYAAAARATGLPLMERPEIAEEPDAGAVIACWFWAEVKRCNPLADAGEVEAWREAINGGLNGLEDVRERYQRALAVQG